MCVYVRLVITIRVLLLMCRLMIVAEQASLSDEVRGLVWEWLIHWPWSTVGGEDASSDGETLVHSLEYEAELRNVTVNTSVFDSNGRFMPVLLAWCHFCR